VAPFPKDLYELKHHVLKVSRKEDKKTGFYVKP